MYKRLHLFCVSVIILFLASCQNNKKDESITIHNDYFNEDRTYYAYSRKDLVNYFIKYGETKQNAKAIERHIYKNNRQEYGLENALIQFSLKSKKTYLVSLEDYNYFSEFIYIRKGSDFYVFPYLEDSAQVQNEETKKNLQFQLCTRKSFVDLMVYHGMLPKEAKKFEKWIFASTNEPFDNISENISDTMKRMDIPYGILIQSYDYWSGPVVIYKNDSFFLFNIIKAYMDFFPNNIKIFENNDESYVLLLNREGFIFTSMAEDWSRAWLALFEKDIKSNLIEKNIAIEPFVENLLKDNNMCIAYYGDYLYYLYDSILYKIDYNLLQSEFYRKIPYLNLK